MRHLMQTFIRCFLEYLFQGGGISLGYDERSDTILVAFSSKKSEAVHTLAIAPQALTEDQFTQERVVKMLCDCLTHNPRTKQSSDEYKAEQMGIDWAKGHVPGGWEDSIKFNVKYDPSIHGALRAMIKGTNK